MEESYIEGLASHGGPESRIGTRKGAGEALTGVCTGGVWSRETRRNQGADAVELTGRQNTCARKGEGTSDPARSKTSSTCRNSMRENREIRAYLLEMVREDALGRSTTVLQRCTGMGSQIAPYYRRSPRTGARAPGAEYNPTPRRRTIESSARHRAG